MEPQGHHSLYEHGGRSQSPPVFEVAFQPLDLVDLAAIGR